VLFSLFLGMNTIDVFLLAGQSNMGGRASADALSETLRAPYDAVLINWINDINFGEGDSSNGWLSLRPQHSPGLGYSHFGPEISLGRRLHQALKKPKIAFVKFALGSTNLHTNWNPSNTNDDGYFHRGFLPHYKKSVELLVEQGYTVKIKGFFWMQGESDGGGNSQVVSSYKQNLSDLIHHVRNLVGEPELPVVLGKINWKKAKKQSVINAAMETVAKEGKNITWVDTSDLTKLPDDHFDGPALVSLGERMAESFIKTTENSI